MIDIIFLFGKFNVSEVVQETLALKADNHISQPAVLLNPSLDRSPRKIRRRGF